MSRDELGLRPDAIVYWCGQSLFKYLPQFDNVFPRIAGQARELPVRVYRIELRTGSNRRL